MEICTKPAAKAETRAFGTAFGFGVKGKIVGKVYLEFAFAGSSVRQGQEMAPNSAFRSVCAAERVQFVYTNRIHLVSWMCTH